MMNYAKKMILMDPRQLPDTNRPTNSTAKAMSKLDQEMENVLQQNMDTNEKVKRYQQILQRYITFQEKLTEPITLRIQEPRVKELNLEQQITNGVPLNKRKKAEQLLKFLKSSNSIAWNQKGELIIQDKAIPHSHIFDLVDDLLRKKKNFSPTGWREFASALKLLNVPESLVGNKDRWNFIKPRIENSVTEPRPWLSYDSA